MHQNLLAYLEILVVEYPVISYPLLLAGFVTIVWFARERRAFAAKINEDADRDYQRALLERQRALDRSNREKDLLCQGCGYDVEEAVGGK